MQISGDDAKNHNAVRLDSFENVNRGELISADEQSGKVAYKDATGSTKEITLGEHAIKILRKYP